MAAGGRRVAVPLAGVRLVLEPQPLARVPARIPGLAGAAAIRGAVIPVFDLAVLLDASAASPARRLVVLEHDGGVGLLVQGAETTEASAAEVEPLDLDRLFAAITP